MVTTPLPDQAELSYNGFGGELRRLLTLYYLLCVDFEKQLPGPVD